MITFYYIYLIQIIRSFTWLRLWNLLVLRITFYVSYIFKIHKTQHYPAFVSIEPTNICNLKCPECPTGIGSSSVKKGTMSFDLFQTIIPQISKHTFFVNLYFQGEPFLNESLPQMISEIYKARMVSSISTNAHFITEENAKKIVASKLTKLIISFDGYNQETYEKYRRNGSFDTVLKSIQTLVQAKKEAHSNLPLIELQCLLFKHTENKTKEIKDLAKNLGADNVVFKTAQFYSTENVEMLPEKKNSRYTVQNNELKIKKNISNKCWRMWSSCVISWQGNIIPCCFDKDHTYSFGNISEQRFDAILQSKQTFQFKKIVHEQRKCMKMCENCTS